MFSRSDVNSGVSSAPTYLTLKQINAGADRMVALHEELEPWPSAIPLR